MGTRNTAKIAHMIFLQMAVINDECTQEEAVDMFIDRWYPNWNEETAI